MDEQTATSVEGPASMVDRREVRVIVWRAVCIIWQERLHRLCRYGDEAAAIEGAVCRVTVTGDRLVIATRRHRRQRQTLETANTSSSTSQAKLHGIYDVDAILNYQKLCYKSNQQMLIRGSELK